MPGRASITVAFALLVGVFTCVAYAEQASAAANVPDGFSDQTVLDQIDAPIALAFTSDGRMLITSKAGELWVYEEGQTDPSVALDLTAQVCANSAERRLLGVAVDPNFATNHYVYLYYTAQVGPDCDSRNEVNRGVALYYERERRGRNDRGRRSRRQHPVAQRGP
jgi:glucose/arabinose dehydrogenase